MIQEWQERGFYSVQTNDGTLISQLYRLIYDKAYTAIARGESVVFRPDPILVNVVKTKILDHKITLQKPLITGLQRV